ncbi:MAG: hypothetical protein AB7K37_11615 [Cyclobacteriaceae bacterium]
MRALLEEAQSSLQDVSLKKNAYKSVSNEREIEFGKIGKLASRIVYNLRAARYPEQVVADALYFSRIIRGVRATKRAPIPSVEAGEKPLRARNYTQQSYVAKADHFAKLVTMVSELPGYDSNAEELKLEALQARAAKLEALNQAVADARSGWIHARLNRNEVMYLGANSLVSNARAVKQYVREAFGANSEQVKALSDISLTKPGNL